MVEKFLDVVNWIDVVTKVGGWIVVLVAIFILFGKQLSVGRLIHKFFKIDGLTFFQSMAIPLLSRDNCVRFARLFMEYVILTNEDGHLNFSSWKKKIIDFKSKYVEDKDNNIIKISNTFILRNEIVKANIEKYFDFIRENADAFSFNTDDVATFLLTIHIENGYLTPLIQISSLQERYNEDWSRVLDHYAIEFNDKNNLKLPSEVASFYTWLMWGPSVCITSEEEYSRACLLGLGDESMAVPIIIPSGLKLEAWDKICSDIKNNIMGTFVVGDFKLCEAIKYLKSKHHTFDEKTLQFVNNTIEKEEKGVLLEATNNVIAKKDAYYSNTMFSAYIWIMLYYYVGENEASFNCKNSTVFFEHANISDSKNVELLTKTLINKCKEYLYAVFNNAELKNRIYNVPWAVNDTILKMFKDEIMKDEFLKEKVRFEDPAISQQSILSSIDNEFDESELSIKYVNIDFNDKTQMGILARFYYELYAEEFPNEDERETIDNIIKQAKRMHEIKECEYHCIVAMHGNKIVGGIIGDYLAECNSGAIEFVVVDKESRHLHIGTTLISNLTDCFNRDAKKYNTKVNCIDYCFFETENPNKVDPTIKDYCISRLHFWNKKLAYRLDMNYVQMPLEAEKSPVDCLYLALMIVNDKLQNQKSIKKELAIKFVECYFKYAFEAENVNDIKELSDLKNELKNVNEVKLERLI